MNDNIQPTTGAPIGLQIRGLRQQRGWTLADLAQRAGTSAPTLHRYESGWERFELETLRRLAAALGTSLRVDFEPLRIESEQALPSKEELARRLRPLFWDRRLEPEDLDHYPHWVLRRVLMFGDREQVAAIRRYFGEDCLRRAAEHREVDPRTRNYWRLLLSSEKDDTQDPQP